MFKKILIANRGEIAVRVMRACREMGIRSVAVFSDVDRKALHVRYADEAFPIGPAPSSESYLRVDRILEAAKQSGAEGVHPGYGFLSENPQFARACEASGVVFIGPSAAAMELMGSKTAARKAVMRAGLPVVPGTDFVLATLDDLRRTADQIGFPIMLKAAAGGGGKGLRLVRSPAELESAYRMAQSEAQNAFNNPSVYIEKYLECPRHIEVQILGDRHGNLIHLAERECSLQRRHQKVMEECPSPLLDEDLRRRMGETAVRIAKLAGYTNAATVEFLVDQDRNFYFLETNTRLQVEHPVTETVVGIDLVQEQLRIAAGEHLAWRQDDVHLRGSALECRVYAEDPENGFLPSPGLITRHREPAGPGVRLDSGVYEGWTVPLEYDPLLSKLIVWGNNRNECIARMQRALTEYEIAGIKTSIPFLRRILDRPDFVAGQIDTGFVDRMLATEGSMQEGPANEAELAAIVASALEFSRQASTPAPAQSLNSTWKIEGRKVLLNHWPAHASRRP
jgi:acetyl-CoA carboxylase biotin carboxylase subunit